MHILCWMYSNTRRVKVINEDIHIKICVTPIQEKRRENYLRRFGHVWLDMQMHKFDEGSVKRAKGRSTWMEMIQKDICARSLNEDILFDRNKWRRIIHVVDPAWFLWFMQRTQVLGIKGLIVVVKAIYFITLSQTRQNILRVRQSGSLGKKYKRDSCLWKLKVSMWCAYVALLIVNSV